MRRKPLKPCAAAGCGALVRGARHCPRHKSLSKPWSGKRVGSGRGGSKWRAKRERVFERDNYLCQICLRSDRLTAVQLHGENHGVCDHIVALSAGGSDDEDNLQTICQSCDREKTQQESQVFIS